MKDLFDLEAVLLERDAEADFLVEGETNLEVAHVLLPATSLNSRGGEGAGDLSLMGSSTSETGAWFQTRFTTRFALAQLRSRAWKVAPLSISSSFS